MLKAKISIILTALSLNACTSVIWNGGVYDADRAVDAQIKFDKVQSESINAFARDNTSGSLMLLGKHYWYAVHPKISQELIAVLQTPYEYRITAPYRGEKLRALPVRLIDKNHFTSDFCLDYQAKNADVKTLQSLGFQAQYRAGHYRKCFAITGQVYTPKPTQPENITSLPYTIPVKAVLLNTKIELQPEKLARNVLLTPLALAVDAASGVIMLPVLVLGDLF
ncbi:hypothetical protein QDY72_00235 [Kingella negevensis]|uniref:hypothetical protein n=1 Tax=Kingella negevensis TaxID=1522312 RepID=UPI00254F723A|nr:hypothetical protein [Kingella negevensis]MDK4680724.1 hypothetical protein [Kingella negevensis]MDK4681553.1 hypothetical protein [Kingella negevensis]MDK4683635.1 hypothetical protein [Kingella negevensis]MDK4691940.1 hypothetical protein [Kingella negevensis]MDK4692907.1 hypothetical protein [Kingella negevensis]